MSAKATTSVFLNLLLKLYGAYNNCYENSVCHAVMNRIGQAVRGSAICSFIATVFSRGVGYSETSLFMKALFAFLGFFAGMLRKISGFIGRINKSGVNYAFLSACGYAGKALAVAVKAVCAVLTAFFAALGAFSLYTHVLRTPYSVASLCLAFVFLIVSLLDVNFIDGTIKNCAAYRLAVWLFSPEE